MISGTMDKIIPAVFITLLFVAIGYTVYINMVNPPKPDHSSDSGRDLRIVLVVNKSIAEWKKLYRKYLNSVIDKYKKYGWPIDDNISLLYSIIDSGGSERILLELHGVDPIDKDFDNWVKVHVKVYVPLFAVELINKSDILSGDDGVEDPCIASIAEAVSNYVENTSNYGYIEFRKAYIILTMVEARMHYSKKGLNPIHPLLALIRGYGICDTQTLVAVALLSRAGLWAASVYVKFNQPPDHLRPAVHIDEFPAWWEKIPKPYIYAWKGKNITFYAWDVTWNRGFIDRAKNSYIEGIWPPYNAEK